MRKLFALVATMAMVLSMFTGIAFAATTPDEIDLTTELVIYTGDADDDLVVTGRILDADGAVATGNYAFTIAQGTEKYYGLARAGIINTIIPGDATPGTYKLTLDAYDTVEEFAGFADLYAEFDVTYKLTTTDTLGFTWGATGDFAYVGKLTGVEGGSVAIVDADDVVQATATVSGRGQFIILMDKEDFEVPGALELRYSSASTYAATGSILVAEGEIAPGTISIDTTESIVYGLDQDVEFVVEYDEDLLLPATTAYVIKIVDADDEDDVFESWTGNWAFSGEEDLEVTDTLSLDKDDAGNYTTIVELLVGGEVAYTAEAGFVVGKPSSLNLVGFDSTGSVEGGYSFELGSDLEIVKIDRYGYAVTATYYDIVAVGAGVDYDNDDECDDEDCEGHIHSGEVIDFEPTRGGTIEFTITGWITNDDGDFVKLGSFTRTITIDGGVATINTTKLEVETAANIVITVVDENGKPVNNAFITPVDENGLALTDADLAAALSVDPTEVNISGGVYTIEIEDDTFTLPATYSFVVVQNGEEIATTEELDVIGQDVYGVTLNQDDVLAGEITDVEVTVKEDGKFLYPTTITIENEDDDEWAFDSDDFAKVDTNDDDVMDSYEIELPAFTEAGTYTVTVKNTNGTEIGIATFEVVLPVVKVNVDKVTNNVNSTFTFTVVDPRDNSILDWDVNVVANDYVDMLFAEAYGEDDVLGEDMAVPTFSEEEAYTLEVLVDADYDAAEEEEEVAELYFEVENDFVTVVLAKTLEVVEPSFTANPETVVTGVPNVVTFTLADANGVVLEGYDVYRGETKIGTTNASGQVTYTVAQVGTDPIEFEVELDSYEDGDGDEWIFVRDVTVKPGFDATAPVVSAPATVDTNTAVITVTDNVRVVRVKIDGVEDTNFFPGTTYTKTVKLVPGANNFVVEAMDNNYNTVKTTVTINYTAKSVVLQGTQVERKGANLFVQIRQFEELGATMQWDAATKSATFTVGNTVVKVTVGSTTATVNGVAKTMPAAPYLSNGRTMAPTRFISEALGWNVQWQAGDIVTITLP